MVRRFALIVLCLAMPLAARADFTTSAFNNSTVQPGGPRAGANGQRFLNIEGSTNGTFASFGVIDFLAAQSTGTVSSLSLSLTESNAGFTRPGALRFFVTTDTTTTIDTGSSPLTFMTSATETTGVGNQLSTLYSLGSATFNTTGNTATGQLDTYTFAVNGALQTYLSSQVNTGGALRLIVAAGDTTVAATYAGFSNTASTTPGPSLTVLVTPSGTAAVPEPASIGLLTIGGLVLAGVARVRRGAAL